MDKVYIRASERNAEYLRIVFNQIAEEKQWDVHFGFDAKPLVQRIKALHDNHTAFILLDGDETHLELLNIGMEIGYLSSLRTHIVVLLLSQVYGETKQTLTNFVLQHGVLFFSIPWLTNEGVSGTIKELYGILDRTVLSVQHRELLLACREEDEDVLIEDDWTEADEQIDTGRLEESVLQEAPIETRKLRIITGGLNEREDTQESRQTGGVGSPDLTKG